MRYEDFLERYADKTDLKRSMQGGSDIPSAVDDLLAASMWHGCSSSAGSWVRWAVDCEPEEIAFLSGCLARVGLEKAAYGMARLHDRLDQFAELEAQLEQAEWQSEDGTCSRLEADIERFYCQVEADLPVETEAETLDRFDAYLDEQGIG